jgi:transcription antitermination protein NusB
MDMEHAMTDLGKASDSDGHVAAGNRRDVRRLAMQVLYQMDVTGERDRRAIIDGLDEGFDNPRVREQGTDLAFSAWENHTEADRRVEALAPEWPTHRQPPVDRAILRLAYHEITRGHAPVKVAINEAVELAKHYASEQSPAFVNGVLDKLAKTAGEAGGAGEPGDGAGGSLGGNPECSRGGSPGGRPGATPAEAGSVDAQAWLDDAEKEDSD